MWKERFEPQLLHLGAQSYETGRPFKKHKSEEDLQKDIIALSVNADAGEPLGGAAPAAATMPEAAVVAVAEGSIRSPSCAGNNAGDAATSNVAGNGSAGNSNSTAAAASHADGNATGKSAGNSADGNGSAAANIAAGSSTAWVCHCPKCGQVLLHSTNIVCLIQLSTGQVDLTTAHPLTANQNHGFAFPRKETPKKDAVHMFNAQCRACEADVGNAHQGHGGHTPVLKCGKTKTSQHVIFKRAGSADVSAKVNAVHTESIYNICVLL